MDEFDGPDQFSPVLPMAAASAPIPESPAHIVQTRFVVDSRLKLQHFPAEIFAEKTDEALSLIHISLHSFFCSSDKSEPEHIVK